MAFTDFTGAGHALRKVILGIEENMPEKQLQKFEFRTNKPNNLKMFYDLRDGLLSEVQIAAIENLRNSNQTIDLHLWNKIAPGNGATRKRIGTGGASPATVAPTFFDPIVEEFETSFINNTLRQYMNEGADKATAIKLAQDNEFSHLFMQKVRNLYTRADRQYYAYLESNKWALTGTADNGSSYTTYTNDEKNVPLSEKLEVLQKMGVEAEENNFMQSGTPYLAISTKSKNLFNEYYKFGANNQENLNQFTDWFSGIYTSNEIVNTAATDIATMYMVHSGGIAGYQNVVDWTAHKDAQDGIVTKGNDFWMNMTVGGEDSGIFTDLPPMQLEIKGYGGNVDNSASLTVDESNIDIVDSIVMTARFGAFHAYDSDSNVKPIIKYRVLGA